MRTSEECGSSDLDAFPEPQVEPATLQYERTPMLNIHPRSLISLTHRIRLGAMVRHCRVVVAEQHLAMADGTPSRFGNFEFLEAEKQIH